MSLSLPVTRLVVTVVAAGLTCGLAACGAPRAIEPTADTTLTLEQPTGSPPATATSTQPATPTSTQPGATIPRPAPARAPVAGPAGRSLTTKVTFYAAGDNDPPGSTIIAFPGTRHDQAAGVGTFDDPITLASDPDQLEVGTIVYYPALRKYFVMEDICEGCLAWSDTGEPHIDLWTGNHSGSAVTECEHTLTPNGTVTVELDPPRGRPVDTTPLFGSRGCLP